MSDGDVSRNPADQLMLGLLRQFNRRWFLKGVGAAAISALPFVGPALSQASARALITCPPDTFGACEDCYTACVSGGRSCACICDSCNCEPLFAEAGCIWTQFGSQCFFSCECYAC
jgi:hypothetical protein